MHRFSEHTIEVSNGNKIFRANSFDDKLVLVNRTNERYIRNRTYARKTCFVLS